MAKVNGAKGVDAMGQFRLICDGDLLDGKQNLMKS